MTEGKESSQSKEFLVTATEGSTARTEARASNPLDAEINHLIDGLRERIKQRMRELVDDAVITERQRRNAEFEKLLAQAYGDGQDEAGFIG